MALAILLLSGNASATGDEPALDAGWIAAAGTSADHTALAQTYKDQAPVLDMRATSHESMARACRAVGSAWGTNPRSLAAYCAMLAVNSHWAIDGDHCQSHIDHLVERIDDQLVDLMRLRIAPLRLREDVPEQSGLDREPILAAFGDCHGD